MFRARLLIGIFLLGCVISGCTTTTTGGSSSGQTLPPRWVYVADDTGQLASVDLDTGKVYRIGKLGAAVSDIAYDAHKNLWAVDPDTFYQIGSDTKQIAIGKHSIPGANALAFGPDGTLYAAGSGSTWLYTIDTATGGGTPIADTGHTCDGGLAFLNGRLFLTSHEMLVSVDPNQSGSTSVVGPIEFTSVWGLAVDSHGQLYGFCGQDAIIIIDPGTGVGTLLWDLAGQGLAPLAGGSFANGS